MQIGVKCSRKREQYVSAQLTLDQFGARMAAEGGDDDHIPPSGSDHLAADDILWTIVATLEDIVGLDRGDQLQRRVLFEHGNGIDKGKGLQGRGTALGRLRRAALALEAPDRVIAVQPDNQPVTLARRLSQKMDVPRVENVETAIREPDLLVAAAPALAG